MEASKIIKARLTCNWCSDEALFARCERMYNTKLYKKNIAFTIDEDYEYLIIINDSINNINHPTDKTIGVMMEPSWAVPFRSKLETICKYIIYHEPNTNNSQYIYYPGLLPPHFDYHEGNTLDFYIKNESVKTKKCSIITSYSSRMVSKQSIYHERVEFVKKILQTNLDVDVYGNNWENSGIQDSRIKGTIKNKKHALLPYEFSIAIENSVEQDYFTEKITDCILTNTTPIYYGCPKIDRFFNNVYQLDNLSSLDQLYEFLKGPALDQTYNKTLMSTKYNLYTALDKLITKLYQRVNE